MSWALHKPAGMTSNEHERPQFLRTCMVRALARNGSNMRRLSPYSFLRSVSVGLLGALFACTGSTGPAGDTGPSGSTALTETTTEPPGSNCPNGGIKIEVGIDANGNGVLDASEVVAANTKYVCNGTGTNSLVKTVDEPAGSNCPFGGTKIETGLDANNNGVLDDSEVNALATSYVCNFGPSGTIDPSTGINVAIKPNGVSTATGAAITVRFTMKDDKGFPLDIAGAYSTNTTIQPRFALGWFTKDATTGIVSPLTIYTQSTSASAPNGQPTSYNPASTGQGTLV